MCDMKKIKLNLKSKFCGILIIEFDKSTEI